MLGMSPWVANRHRPTFGEDADEWRPERWVGISTEEYRKMDGSILSVGSDSI